MKPTHKENPPTLSHFTFSKRTFLFILFLLVLAFSFWIFSLAQRNGTVALVSVGLDENQTTHELSLSEDGTVFIDEGTDYPATLLIENGSIRFINSVCPDGLCENFGRLSSEGEWALCAPGNVMVRVIEP